MNSKYVPESRYNVNQFQYIFITTTICYNDNNEMKLSSSKIELLY